MNKRSINLSNSSLTILCGWNYKISARESRVLQSDNSQILIWRTTSECVQEAHGNMAPDRRQSKYKQVIPWQARLIDWLRIYSSSKLVQMSAYCCENPKKELLAATNTTLTVCFPPLPCAGAKWEAIKVLHDVTSCHFIDSACQRGWPRLLVWIRKHGKEIVTCSVWCTCMQYFILDLGRKPFKAQEDSNSYSIINVHCY